MEILYSEGGCMNNFFLVGLFIFLIILTIEVIQYKKKNTAVVKSIRRLNGWAILFSILWFVLALLHLKILLKYKITDIGINFEFDRLYIVILYILAAIIWLFRGFKKDIIHESGIYISNGNYTWNRVISYKWGVKECKKIRENSIEYYKLTFRLYRNKVDKLLCGVEYKEIDLEIDKEDKEQVEVFLEEIISEE